MLDWPNQVENGASLEFDVCIAGAGAAGITLALELENSGLSVCLLEGGGLQAPRLSVDHPYNGESVGRNYNLLTTRAALSGRQHQPLGWVVPASGPSRLCLPSRYSPKRLAAGSWQARSLL